MVQAMVQVKMTRYRPNTSHISSTAVNLNVDTTPESVQAGLFTSTVGW